MSCDNTTNPGKFPLVPIYDAILFCDLGGEREWVYEQVNFIKEQCRKREESEDDQTLYD